MFRSFGMMLARTGVFRTVHVLWSHFGVLVEWFFLPLLIGLLYIVLLLPIALIYRLREGSSEASTPKRF